MIVLLRRVREARDALRRGDAGTTLVEMLVATIIFTIILAIISTAIISMIRASQKDNGQANDLDASRKVIETLDHQARYANAISNPGNSSYSNGCVTGSTCYIEWRTGNTGQQQTCTQWKFTPTTGRIQSRTWQPNLTGNATVVATGWATEAIGISQVNTSTPIFSITPPTTAQQNNDTHYPLTVDFTTTSGSPSSTSATQVTVTAINSTRSPASPTPLPVCTEVTRS